MKDEIKLAASDSTMETGDPWNDKLKVCDARFEAALTEIQNRIYLTEKDLWKFFLAKNITARRSHKNSIPFSYNPGDLFERYRAALDNEVGSIQLNTDDFRWSDDAEASVYDDLGYFQSFMEGQVNDLKMIQEDFGDFMLTHLVKSDDDSEEDFYHHPDLKVEELKRYGEQNGY
jgi:hypothetical protein